MASPCGGNKDLFHCGAGYPSDFCCKTDQTCNSLAGDNSTILCCPKGSNCDYISPLTCELTQQNITGSKLQSDPPVALQNCSSACCPPEYLCIHDVCMRKGTSEPPWVAFGLSDEPTTTVKAISTQELSVNLGSQTSTANTKSSSLLDTWATGSWDKHSIPDAGPWASIAAATQTASSSQAKQPSSTASAGSHLPSHSKTSQSTSQMNVTAKGLLGSLAGLVSIALILLFYWLWIRHKRKNQRRVAEARVEALKTLCETLELDGKVLSTVNVQELDGHRTPKELAV